MRLKDDFFFIWATVSNYTKTGINDNWNKSEIVDSCLKLSHKNTQTARTHTLSKDKRLHVGGFLPPELRKITWRAAWRLMDSDLSANSVFTVKIVSKCLRHPWVMKTVCIQTYLCMCVCVWWIYHMKGWNTSVYFSVNCVHIDISHFDILKRSFSENLPSKVITSKFM